MMGWWLVGSVAQAVVVSHDPIPVGGGAVTVRVDGLAAFESAKIVFGRSPGLGPCPGVLGGVCLGIVNAKQLGGAGADATGHAELVAMFPNSLSAGQTVALQAAVARGVGGVDSVVSAVVVAQVGAVDADGDGFDTSTDCDDGDPDVHPGALELCDGIDGDCDPGTLEDGLVTVGITNYPTIGDAVFFAPPGDTVAVCAGVWAEALAVDRDVVLLGVAGAAATVIDATGLGVPVVDLANGVAATIDGLTLTGGTSGVEVGPLGELTMRHAVVTDNHSALSGGGITDGSQVVAPMSLDLEDVEISYNTAAVHGGGIFLVAGSHTFADVRLIGNEAGHAGGGIFLGNTGPTTITGSTFHANLAAAGAGLDQGGAFFMNVAAGAVTVVDSDFGVGATENLPNDVRVYDAVSPVVYTFFQDHESFVCSTASNNCL